jgi:membrane protease YdiL (CAAX protease family)
MSQEPTSKQQGGLVPFFVLTYLITWGIAALFFLLPGPFEAIFGKLSMSSPIFVVAVAAPTIAATLITFVLGRWAGLRDLYARLLRWRFGLQWYALVLVGVAVLAYLVSRVAGAPSQVDLSTPLLVLNFLLGQLILGPLGEELGWRGFALPRLLRRFSPLVASLILGLIWGVWHLPSFFVSTLVQSSLIIPVFLAGAVCMAILATWLYLHTGGSVLVSVLFHLAVNASMAAFGTSFTWFMAALATCAVLVVTLDRGLGWLRAVRAPAYQPATAAE